MSIPVRAEISEIITHFAFYAGWDNAMAATAITKEVFSAWDELRSTSRGRR